MTRPAGPDPSTGASPRPELNEDGTPGGPIPAGSTHCQTLVYLPGRRIVATFRYARQARALAAELAGVWARSGGEAEDIRAGPLIERHKREAT